MVENGFLKIESMRLRCSDAEWQARVDLAACYRLVAIYGMSDMIANHTPSRPASSRSTTMATSCPSPILAI